MPELPEVETIRCLLDEALSGDTITDAEVRREEIILHPSPDDFRAAISGERIMKVSRRGKFLIIVLEDGYIAIHLRMTGTLLPVPSGYPEEKHTHVVIDLKSGRELRFSDQRRFGRISFIRNGEEDAFTGISRLGPEPFDASLTAGYLRNRLGKRKRAIKECIMDQSVVAGIGNIYGDEILFEAGIRPDRAACGIHDDEWEALSRAIPERLSFFIGKNSTTLSEYIEEHGREYRNTPYIRIYGHEGEPCPRCGATLRRMMQGGRSSTYCPECQR